MRRVKNPILLDANLNDQEMLRPTKGSLSLQLCDVSECSLTLPLDSPNVHMHAWIKVFNQNGLVGIFRRTSNNRNIPNDLSTTFRHGIDILQDSIWDDETDFEGTKAEFLAALLNKQTSLINGVKPWVLGTCADTSTYKKSIKYNNLLDLFQDLEDEGGDYYFSYNQTVWPWTVSFLQRSNTVASEFRLARNMEKCRISENDSELCTRLVLQINSMMTDASLDDVKQNKTVARTYNNAAAQAIYGVIVKTEDIDTTDSVPNGPFPDSDAFAAKYLADRAAPLVTVQIDGRELYRQTGDTWDEAQMGTLCRAAIPDYDTYIAQRLVGVNYPDLFGVPDRVVLTLSNATPKTLRDKSNLSRSVASAERTAVRAGGGGRSNAREIESFDQHFKIVDDSNSVLKQAGMHLDANGLLVYADDNQNMVGSRFNVQADKIGMVVGENQSGNFIKAGEIALAINATTGESTAYINANHVNISATNTVHTLAGDVEHDAQGRLVIKNAGGMYVQRTESGITTKYGVFDNGNLTGGVVVEKINGQKGTITRVRGSVIVIGDDQTIDPTYRGKTLDGTLTQITSDFTTVNTLLAKKIEADDINATTVTAALSKATLVNVKQLSASSSIGCTGPISGASLSIGGHSMNIYDGQVSSDGTTLTLFRLSGGSLSFNKAATLQATYGGSNQGTQATYTVTGSPAANFPSGATKTGTFTLHINAKAAWVTDPDGTIRARVDNPADADAAYNSGWNDCRDAALDSGWDLSYYTGSVTTKYDAPSYGAQGRKVIYPYSSHSRTVYNIPDAK